MQMRVRPSEHGLEDLVEGVEGDVGAYVEPAPDRRRCVLQVDPHPVQDCFCAPRATPGCAWRWSEVATPGEEVCRKLPQIVELHPGDGLAEPGENLICWLRLGSCHAKTLTSMDFRHRGGFIQPIWPSAEPVPSDGSVRRFRVPSDAASCQARRRGRAAGRGASGRPLAADWPHQVALPGAFRAVRQTADMTLIRQFRELGREDIEIAGGKGANLGELTRAGLPVPPGFVVTTDAYRAFVESAGIGPKIIELASGGGSEAADQIRELFRSHPVPDELGRRDRGRLSSPW